MNKTIEMRQPSETRTGTHRILYIVEFVKNFMESSSSYEIISRSRRLLLCEAYHNKRKFHVRSTLKGERLDDGTINNRESR